MTGISAPQWTAIILFAAGTVGVIIRWLWVRFWQRFDGMHDAIHHPEGALAAIRKDLAGIIERFTKYTPREQLDMQIAELGAQLKEAGSERSQSEQRILSTLREMHRENKAEISEIRSEVGQIHRRIDALLVQRGP